MSPEQLTWLIIAIAIVVVGGIIIYLDWKDDQ
jgi:hypothetical protein